MDVNLDNTACVVSKSHVGYDDIVNICSGQHTIVWWTGLDWLGAGILALLLTLLLLGLAFIAWLGIEEVRR